MTFDPQNTALFSRQEFENLLAAAEARDASIHLAKTHRGVAMVVPGENDPEEDGDTDDWLLIFAAGMGDKAAQEGSEPVDPHAVTGTDEDFELDFGTDPVREALQTAADVPFFAFEFETDEEGVGLRLHGIHSD